MSEAVGPLSFSDGGDNQLYRPYSEKTQQLIDSEVNKIIATSYDRSVALLREHETKLHALAEALLEKEVIGSEELVAILGPRSDKSKEYMEYVDVHWGDVPGEELRRQSSAQPDEPKGPPPAEQAVPAAA